MRPVARVEPVGDRVEPLAGQVDLGAVGEVAARVEPHAEQRVARLGAARAAPPGWPGCRSWPARWQSRSRTAASPGRWRAPRRRRRTGSRHSSAGPDSLRRTCWSAPSPAPPAPPCEAMFSEAISSISFCWRSSSSAMARAISGSVSASELVEERTCRSGFTQAHGDPPSSRDLWAACRVAAEDAPRVTRARTLVTPVAARNAAAARCDISRLRATFA